MSERDRLVAVVSERDISTVVVSSILSYFHFYSASSSRVDFSSQNAFLTYGSGVTVGEIRCITVRIFEDSRVENTEYFTFSIRRNYRTQIVGSSSFRINIMDNDGKTSLL